MTLIKNKIFISGGGTGGHLFPALAIGEELINSGYEVLYIGSKHGMESNYFINKKVKSFELLDIYGINRQMTLKGIIKNIIFPIKFIGSYLKSRKLIKKLEPKIIIGTGGYSSGLPLLAGIHLGIPTFIQDQNSIPGLITKKLHKKVTKICTAYKEFPIDNKIKNIIYTGNPIRSDLKKIERNYAIEKLGLDCNKMTIFILGGSQGSRPINNHIINNINFYDKYQVIWQCGYNNYNEIPEKITNRSNILIKKFYNDMSLVYSASDLIISRAGALAISELLVMKKAFILIPFKYAANNHQDINAKMIEKRNACIRIDEKELKTGLLEKTISNIFLNKQILYDLQKNSEKISKPNATKDIINEIKKIIE